MRFDTLIHDKMGIHVRARGKEYFMRLRLGQSGYRKNFSVFLSHLYKGLTYTRVSLYQIR